MRVPDIEEVIAHFEQAKIVKCLYNGDESDITRNIVEDIYARGGSYWIELLHHRGATLKLWSEYHGYAKIISYKEKTYQITENQIKEVEKEGVHKLKELFPEVFKPVLEVGKWYKQKGDLVDWLMCYTGDGLGYGFNTSKKYGTDYVMGESEKWEEAYIEEIEEALINEAKKRGFKEGVKINSEWLINKPKTIIYDNIFFDKPFELCIGTHSSMLTLFKNGKWAKIVKEEPVELTLQEIADKFEIDVELLKIKK